MGEPVLRSARNETAGIAALFQGFSDTEGHKSQPADSAPN